ncbi:MAG: hypothetical protein AAGE43_20220 [Pseudomonadota bacterium]
MNGGIRNLGYLFGAAGLSLALAGLALATQGPLEPGLQTALRWTGRVAFFVFLIPWLAAPLSVLAPGAVAARLRAWRRRAGICFGAMQVVHLALIVWLFQVAAETPADAGTLVVGGTGLALALAMLWTSFDGPRRALDPVNWQRLHKAGVTLFSFIYFFDFVVVPIQEQSLLAYLPFTLLTLGALLLRTLAFFREREQLPAYPMR